MIGKMMLLDRPAYEHFLQKQKVALISQLIVLCLGLAYGVAGIIANATFIASFESGLLRTVIVPLIFIGFGLISAWLTKIGLTVLLWAGAKGFGGPGKMSEVNRATSVALIPGIFALPVLTGAANSVFTLFMMGVGVVWMYLICVKIHETTQGFTSWKAYAAVLAVFIFFSSIYYLVMPTSALQ
ncbi:hypothetical protein [Evansella halocellulosilytica]|uniref:hypothetical protein n=1 Tax=Evansella halocellulosilytica TaxID=2011013 RepID=UPI000BB998B3|nr:hypothetical protein [Evansella halocellulosilytica]